MRVTRSTWLVGRGRPQTGYIAAIAAVAVATALRYAVDPYMPPGYPFLTFFPAVIVTTLIWGLYPGVLAALVSTFTAWWLFMPGATLDASATWVALLFFLSVTAVDIAIIHVMNRALIRVQEEQDRSSALARENETMLREAQHRISNNLQMLASILMLQRGAMSDEAARHALAEAANRLRLVGKIQRDLYSPNGATDVASFLRDLAADAVDAAGNPGVTCSVDAVEASLPPDQLTPLGLIMLELIANAIEHGGDAEGRIRIEVSLSLTPQGYRLIVTDDGFGLPENFELEKAESLGLRIVRAMASQLHGTFRFETGQGCRAVLIFPVPASPELAARA